MQLAASHAIACASKAVDLVHAAAGTSAIRSEKRFQQWFRDVHTITSARLRFGEPLQSVGALMLGAELDWGFFAL